MDIYFIVWVLVQNYVTYFVAEIVIAALSYFWP